MDEAEALEGIAGEMDAILSRFKRTRDGVWIADGDGAKFTGLVLEARDLMAQIGEYRQERLDDLDRQADEVAAQNK